MNLNPTLIINWGGINNLNFIFIRVMIWPDGLAIGEIIVSENGLLHWRKIQKELSVLEDLALSVMTDTQIINLGYRFSIKWWGKGLATELAKYAVTYGISILKLAEISAVVRPNHLASQSSWLQQVSGMRVIFIMWKMNPQACFSLWLWMSGTIL